MAECTRFEDVYGPVASAEPAWNGGAVLVRSFEGDGYYSFRVSKNAVGIVLGFATDPSGEEYQKTNFGFLFTKSHYSIIENGVERTTRKLFTSAQTFYVVRDGDTIHYCVGTTYEGPYYPYPGKIIYTSLLPSYGRVYLDASLYNKDDEILCVGMGDLTAQVSYADGSFRLAGLASEDAYNECSGSFTLSAYSSGSGTSSSYGTFSLFGVSSETDYNYVLGDFSLVGQSYAGIVIPLEKANGWFSLEGSAISSEYIPAGADGDFSIAGRATYSATSADTTGSFYFLGYASGPLPPPQNYLNISLGFRGYHPFDYALAYLSLTDVATVEVIYKAMERLRLSATFSIPAVMQQILNEGWNFNSRVWFVENMSAVDNGLTLTSTVSAYTLATLLSRDILSFEAAPSIELSLLASLSDNLSFNSFVSFIESVEAITSFTLSSSISSDSKYYASANTTLTFTPACSPSLVFFASETLDLSTTASLSSIIEVILRERLLFLADLPLDDGLYNAVVMNADTSALTTYSNYGFNSLINYRKKGYGLSDNALYVLTGSTDDGTNIDARAATGDIEFGRNMEYGCIRATLHLQQEGDMVLKTVTSRLGERRETYYTLALRDASQDINLRKEKLGQGVRGVWWRFELHNVDGKDFQLTDMEVYPIELFKIGY